MVDRCLFESGGHTRPICAEEVERFVGLGAAYSVDALALQKTPAIGLWRASRTRPGLLAGLPALVVRQHLVSQLLYQAEVCDRLDPLDLVEPCADGGVESQPRLADDAMSCVGPDAERSTDLGRLIALEIARRADMRGTDVRVDLGIPYMASRWPRSPVDVSR